MAHLGGYEIGEIARSFGYAKSESVARTLKHRVVQALVAKIRDAQLQRVLEGTYGVQATARAAAPEIMAHVTELAGAKKSADGVRLGRARRDADALRVARVALHESLEGRDVGGRRRSMTRIGALLRAQAATVSQSTSGDAR